VTCQGCEFVWYSQAMVEGLRLLGSCPRCGGELAFHAKGAAAIEPVVTDTAPERVLGIPRRQR
jgi:hypothetical protein